MNRRWKHWTAGMAVAGLLLAAGAFGWADYQLRRIAGAWTEVVDRASFEAPTQRVAVMDVNVLSHDGREMLPHRTVVVDEGRIVAVDAAAAVPDGTRRINGRGRFLVPGFIDTHVHLRRSPNDLLLYLASGVTSIAEMSGDANHLAWRRDTQSGAAGPRMFIASRKLENWGLLRGWFQAWTRQRISVGAADNAADVVNELAADGYDAVKLGTFVDRDTYFVVSKAADAAEIALIGHIPNAVDLDDVWSSSQHEIAHIEELVKALDAEFGYFNSRNTDEFLSFVHERGADVAAKLRANGIAVSTTLWLVNSIHRQALGEASLLQEIALPYANPGQVEGTPLSAGWLASNNPYLIDASADESDRAAARRYWTVYAQAHRLLLRALVDGGVHVMAGTDAGNAVVVPGFSLHDEMQALVDAGLSPGAALGAATLAAGEWLGEDTGRIQAGYRADLVLLEGNPLEHIENTRRIAAVIAAGRVFDRARLDAMLDAVKAANDASRSIPLEYPR